LLTRPIRRMTPINPIMLNSVSQSIGASTAPTPADGGIDRMLLEGPSTMAMAVNAARISHCSVSPEIDLNLPWVRQAWP
jgi:hypothetical protein